MAGCQEKKQPISSTLLLKGTIYRLSVALEGATMFRLMSPQAFFLVIVGLVRTSRTEELKMDVGRRTREGRGNRQGQ